MLMGAENGIDVVELQLQVKAQARVITALEARVKRLERPPKPEAYYQRLVEKITGGKHMHLEGVGTTDVTTPDAHIEIKSWHRYHEVIGQLYKYQKACPRSKSVVYFFGIPPSSKRLNSIVESMVANDIRMYSFDDDEFVVTHNIIPSEAVKTSFQTWCEEHLRTCVGGKVHVHRVVDLYNSGQESKDQLGARRASKMLQAAGFVVGKRCRISNCDNFCVRGKKDLPFVANVAFV